MKYNIILANVNQIVDLKFRQATQLFFFIFLYYTKKTYYRFRIFITIILLIINTCFCNINSFSQVSTVNDSIKVQNIIAFTKLYGYIRYFHPSDEASSINWDKFAIYGAKMVEKAKDTDDLINILNQLFKPIAPSILISKANIDIKFDINSIKPINSKHYKTIAWQHEGIDLGYELKWPYYWNEYKSIRTNRNTVKDFGEINFEEVETGILIKKYKAKEFKLVGNAKINSQLDGSGHFYVNIMNNKGEMLFFNNMHENPIISNKWSQYVIYGHIDTGAYSISFGTFLKGKGEMFVDDIKLYYKEDSNWIEIPLKNSDFSFKEFKSDCGWLKGDRKHYKVSITDKELPNKNKCLSIKYIPKTRKIHGRRIYKEIPKIGETINEDIGSGIKCIVPIALYGNKKETFPPTSKIELDSLKDQIEKFNVANINDRYLQLGNIVIAWNIFQHFYPYLKETQNDWVNELKNAVKLCYEAKTEMDYFLLLEEFTAKLNDTHLYIKGHTQTGTYFPPFQWEWIDKKLVITKVFDKSLTLKIGNIVEKIENKDPVLYFDSISKYISASTESRKKSESERNSLIGFKNEPINLQINGFGNIDIKRDVYINRYYSLIYPNDSVQYKFLQDDITYLDFSYIKMETIRRLLPKLKTCKYIICDLRGYPNDNDNFICYLLKRNDTLKHYGSIHNLVPQIIYPDQSNLNKFKSYSGSYKARKPHINAKIIFLTNSSAQCYSETFLETIQHYKLATIIGQQTAGVIGNENSISLPGDYVISFTATYGSRIDGSQLYGIGIIPDIYVNKTIKGIIEGKDEYMERALEFIKTSK